MTRGKAVAGQLLVELQVRKSTADGAGTREFYTALTSPLPGWDSKICDVVLKKKLVRVVMDLIGSVLINGWVQPRKIFVQPNTSVVDGEVKLKEYPLTNAGVIESFIERKL